jgi:hypothetical protein
MAYDFSTNAIAFNSLGLYEDEAEEYNTFGSSNIYFIVDSMEGMTENDMNFVALHEMTHSFGLDDIYDEEFIGLTLMYGLLEGQEDSLNPVLTSFDLYNLAYIYYIAEEIEEE